MKQSFEKAFNGSKLLTIFAKTYTGDIQQVPKFTSDEGIIHLERMQNFPKKTFVTP